MNHHRLRDVALFVLLFAPAVAHAATGQPDFSTAQDTGLYVWRTTSGVWQLRVLAADGRRHATGRFDTGSRVTSANRVALESSDRLEAGARSVAFDFDTARQTLDGLAFQAGTGSVCLHTDDELPIYLGRDAQPAVAPVDLTRSGGCDVGFQTTANLTVFRPSRLEWQVRLAAAHDPAHFDGFLEFTDPPEAYQEVSLEGGDILEAPVPERLTVQLNTWPGGVDGVDFTMAEFSGICLRSNGGPQLVTLTSPGLATPFRKLTPVDLTHNGACGLPTDPFPPPTRGRKFNPGHYVALTWRDGAPDIAESDLPGVRGLLRRYAWRVLEPTPGSYDFSAIEADLALAKLHGLQLVALIEDKTFRDAQPVPDYLVDRTLPNRKGGYTVIRWDPYVVTRHRLLVEALGRRFDAEPRFEGIATEESAVGVDEALLAEAGYSAERYRDALIEILSDAAVSLPTSRVFWYMNFVNGGVHYVGEIARAVAPLGVAMGGPDVMPDNLALQRHPYPFYDGFVGQMPLFNQVEQACYHHRHVDPLAETTFWTPQELFDYARQELHVSYLFWVRWRFRVHPEAYDWWDAIPVIGETPTFNHGADAD